MNNTVVDHIKNNPLHQPFKQYDILIDNGISYKAVLFEQVKPNVWVYKPSVLINGIKYEENPEIII